MEDEEATTSSGVKEQVKGDTEEEMEEPDSEEDEEEQEFLPGYPTLQNYSKALLSEVVKATKAGNGLPEEGDDYDYYSSFPGFSTFCSKMGSRVTRSIGRIIKHQSLPCYWPPHSQTPPTEEAGLVAMVEERMEALIEANDVLLERVSVLMDEACGLRKKGEERMLSSSSTSSKLHRGTAEVASWNTSQSPEKRKFHFFASRNVPRPQVRFHDHIDNSNSDFVPLLRTKPNARQPLPAVYQKLQAPQTLNSLIANSKEWAMTKKNHIHPYKFELENFVPTDTQLQLTEPKAPGSLEEVPYTYVSTEEELEELVSSLLECSEFAIDLENHSYRSFQGFVCLMQISTRNHDYIVDTLELRHVMHRFLDPFTNPNIVKVFHGADWDIPWLQRDFGLYVVNMFDTGVASRLLELPKHSLAFLLHYCCSVTANKQYQLADWRIRPLPPELVKYAREDTHYLLYIYDRMRNELIRRKKGVHDLLKITLDKSRDVCLRTYQKPATAPNGYLKLYHKHKQTFSSQQLYCLKVLYEWRDGVAREEDESLGYVLPNHMMFQIARQLPREPQGVLACCTPIPTLLRQQLQEVFLLVQQARDSPLTSELPKLKVSPEEEREEETTPPTTPTSTVAPPPERVTPHSEPLIGSHWEHCKIQLKGPPIPSSSPSLSAIESIAPELSEKAREQLEEIKRSFPDVLSQFLDPSSYSPSSSSSSSSATAGPIEPSPSVEGETSFKVTGKSGSSVSLPGSQNDASPVATAGTGDGGGEGEQTTGKKRKKLSVREMGRGGGKRKKVSPPNVTTREEGEICEEEEEGGEVERVEHEEGIKKMKFTEDRSVLSSFKYDGVNFTDFTKDRTETAAAVFQPKFVSPSGKKGGGGGGGARSKVHLKSGEKSHTHGNNKRPASSQRLWPKAR